LLAYITYFIVTVIIRFVQRAANLAAACSLVVGLDGRLPARYTRCFYFVCLFTWKPITQYLFVLLCQAVENPTPYEIRDVLSQAGCDIGVEVRII